MNYGSPIVGTLTGTSATVQVPNIPYPASIILNSAELTRAIQLSFDFGDTWMTAVTPTLTATSQIVYALTYPCTHVKFTGVAEDTYTIL